MFKNKLTLILVIVLSVLGLSIIGFGIFLATRPLELPQTGSADYCTSGFNNGYIFVCDAPDCNGGTFSCNDKNCYSDAYAHACAPIMKTGDSCAGKTNLGIGPWPIATGSPATQTGSASNFVGCHFGGSYPQNCFCNDGMSGQVTCYTDTYGWGTTYDSCGARFFPPTTTTPPTTTPKEVYKCGEPDVANGVYCYSEDDCEDFVNATLKTCNADGTCTTSTQRLNVECNLKLSFDPIGNKGICALRDEQCGELGYSADGYCGCIKTVTTPTPTTATPTPTPTATPPITTTTPTATATPTATPTVPVTTVIPQTALISDEMDRIVVGTGLFAIGVLLFATGKHVGLGNALWYQGGLKILSRFSKKLRKEQLEAERDNFETRF